jgi:hypothetical protein
MPRPEVVRRAIVVLALLAPAGARAEEDLARGFTETVRPFVESYCLPCHGHEKPKGQLDLAAYTTLDSVVRGAKQWEAVLEMLASREMPPAKAKKHPPDELRGGSPTGSRRSAGRRPAAPPGIRGRCWPAG